MDLEEKKPKKELRRLIFMIGESGCGKSTIARKMKESAPDKFEILTKDDLREELKNDPDAPKKNGAFEQFVGKVQMARADKFLKEDKIVIIADTNLTESARARWENFCHHKAEFVPYRIFESLETCVERDSKRTGKARVGPAVIHRQFVISKRLPIDPDKMIVICDLDGTIASHEGIRNVYDESRVGEDKIIPVVKDWVNALAEDHTIIIVSGRHSTCGYDTVEWLKKNHVKYDFILMRHSFDNRSDVLVKQQILDELLQLIPKDNIDFAIDDRNVVIQNVWKKNGIKVFPIAGTIDHRKNCTYKMTKEDKRCKECYALADF